ncbi:hypothetical protein [Amantichitinum ursilacus]|uniref:Chemotaxis phosphatase CheX-like domain-containing protein n=1 Tax=Amantichitinum ursilacus TaxID=857265 RepID=A0A0N0XLQ5_9NEIS|nr:hypothetical protein [Amantichitinum ursilacus]KPC54278.1 hypothetical protein WG78_06500 [Amantichitinum ursilacus]
MFSHAALENIYTLFEQSIQANAVALPSDVCVIERIALPDANGRPGHAVVLNISSYLFRIIALFDFEADATTGAHLALRGRSATPVLEGQALVDVLGELVNMICGSVNRSLCAAFRHAAMSTPFVLERHCARYINEVAPTAQQTFVITLNDSVRFGLTLSLCAAAGSDIDFRLAPAPVQEAVAGELEFF